MKFITTEFSDSSATTEPCVFATDLEAYKKIDTIIKTADDFNSLLDKVIRNMLSVYIIREGVSTKTTGENKALGVSFKKIEKTEITATEENFFSLYYSYFNKNLELGFYNRENMIIRTSDRLNKEIAQVICSLIRQECKETDFAEFLRIVESAEKPA